MGAIDKSAAAYTVGNMEVKPSVDSDKPKVKPAEVEKPKDMSYREKQKDLQLLREAMDKYIRNTRYSYSVNEKIDQFVVTIIDRETDNVIKQIPSQEIQRMHENIQEAIGILFDTQI